MVNPVLAYAVAQAYANIFPSPIIAKRNPLVTDKNFPIGQIWLNYVLNTSYILTSIVSNQAQWKEITNSGGGAGVFSSLTVTPGPTALTGAFTVTSAGNAVSIAADSAASAISLGNTTGATGITARVGTGNFSLDGVAASTYSVGASTTTGTISIGGTGAQTGTISIAPGTGAQQVLIADGNTGVKSVAIAAGTVANIVTIGSTTGAASTTISGGTLGVNIDTPTPAVATGGIFVLQGAIPFRIMCGTGAPNNNLALEAGDLYVRNDPAGATSRLYIATAANTWTNITCAG